MSLPRQFPYKSTDFALTMLFLGFVISSVLVYHFGLHEQLYYPYNTPLFAPGLFLGDLKGLFMSVDGLNPYFGPLLSTQPPFLNLFAYTLTIPPIGVGYWLYFILSIGGLFAVVYNFFIHHPYRLLTTSLVSFSTYPFWFCIDRGNLEIIVVVAIMGGLILFQKERFHLSALLWAFAGALKVYPLIFTLLLIKKKKWKSLAICLLLFVSLTLISLSVFEGGLTSNLMTFINSKQLNYPLIKRMMDIEPMVQRGVSLFSFVKIIALYLNSQTFLKHLQTIYFFFSITASLLITIPFFMKRFQHDDRISFSLICFFCLLVPAISADYKLLLLIPVLCQLLQKYEFDIIDKAKLFLLILCLLPKNYFFLPHVYSDSLMYDLGIGTLINPIVLAALFFIELLPKKKMNS